MGEGRDVETSSSWNTVTPSSGIFGILRNSFSPPPFFISLYGEEQCLLEWWLLLFLSLFLILFRNNSKGPNKYNNTDIDPKVQQCWQNPPVHGSFLWPMWKSLCLFSFFKVYPLVKHGHILPKADPSENIYLWYRQHAWLNWPPKQGSKKTVQGEKKSIRQKCVSHLSNSKQ